MCRMPLGIAPAGARHIAESHGDSGRCVACRWASRPLGPDISPSLTVTVGDVSHAAGRARLDRSLSNQPHSQRARHAALNAKALFGTESADAALALADRARVATVTEHTLRRADDVLGRRAHAILIADAPVTFGAAGFAIARRVLGRREVDDAAASSKPEHKKQGHPESYELHRTSVARTGRQEQE